MQEKHGLLDTEWTLKFTELLKIESERRLVDDKVSDQKKAKISENLAKFRQADFQRRRCYEEIELLHDAEPKDKTLQKL